MELMNRDTNKDPFPTPPSKIEVDRFQKTNQGGPTQDLLRLDVTGYRIQSRWNQTGALIVAREYITRDYSLSKKLKVVQGFVLRHIPALVRQYKAMGSNTSDPVVREQVDRQTERDSRNSRRRGVRTVKTTDPNRTDLLRCS